MGEPPLSTYEVIRFLVQKGGRCTNYELVSNFRGILNDPQYQAEARLKFKDIINTVAIVGEYQNVKYIELKKEHFPSNNVQQHHEETTRSPGHSSDHSSLSSETSTSSYTSPLTQNFQPYWRYRLSTSKQVLPSRRSEYDSFLQSSMYKSSVSFNRSVSESTLPQDNSFPTRTRTNRSSSVEQDHNDNTQNQQSLGWSRQCIDDNKGPPRHYYPERPARRYSLHHYDGAQHSYSQNYSDLSPNNNNMSLSLPYYSCEESIFTPESEMKQKSQEELSSRKNSCATENRSDLPMTNPEVNVHGPRQIDKNEVYGNQMDKRSDDVFLQYYVNNTRKLHDQRHSFDDNRSMQADHPIRSFKSNHDNSALYGYNERLETLRPAQNNGEHFIESKNTIPLPKRNADFQRVSDDNGEIDEENNMFTDAEYMRSVSKLCLEKTKGHRNSIAQSEKNLRNSEQQIKTNKDSNLETAFSKENIRTENLVDKNSDVDKKFGIPSVENSAASLEQDPPIPPERRRKSQDKTSRQTEETKDIKSDATEQDAPQSPAPNKVRDRVQHFDEMEKKQRKGSSDKENAIVPKTIAMDDDVSISVLDPKLKREWFVKASQCDYHALVALLKKEPKLAALKDVASGYTALHWAAKQGDANIIKLIAGAYKVNPNIRSNGGYTPIHLAALYKHDMISHLLIHTYGADPSVRDYSGKRADQYPDNYIRQLAGHKNIERRPLKQRPLVAKEASTNSFIRIGSLNLRKARKSAMFASVRSSHRNRSSVPELRLGNHGNTRKKAHKSLHLDKSIAEKKNDSDSDSAYGFTAKNKY